MKKIFGKSLGAILCSVIAISMFTISGKAETEIKDKYLGIQLYSVMDAMIKDPKGSIVRLTDMGYNVCELVQWGGDTKVFGLPAEEFKAFCDQKGMEIIPVEVKGGEDKSAPSFKRYVSEHHPEYALRFSKRGYRKDGEITNIPLYLARKTKDLL